MTSAGCLPKQPAAPSAIGWDVNLLFSLSAYCDSQLNFLLILTIKSKKGSKIRAAKALKVTKTYRLDLEKKIDLIYRLDSGGLLS
jgi:hypothetical protein